MLSTTHYDAIPSCGVEGYRKNRPPADDLTVHAGLYCPKASMWCSRV